MVNESKLLNIFRQYSQIDLINHFQALTVSDKQLFLNDASDFDFNLVFDLYNKYSRCSLPAPHKIDICSAHIFTLVKTNDEFKRQENAYCLGQDILRKNKIAVLIAAGGQGSRLNYSQPKGMFPIAPVTQKSLFQIFSENIKAISLKYNCNIPLLIMVNPETHATIVEFFKVNNYFGLNSDNIHFLVQTILPSITPEGKLILKDNTHLFANANGHGGALEAIHTSGLLQKLKNKGYQEIFYCQVDNPLVKIADPEFIGYHCGENCEISTKVIRRHSCDENVGIFVAEENKAHVIEYSDLTSENRCVLDAKGKIRDWAGNTGIHMFSLDFIERLNKNGLALPYHRAIKAVNAIDSDGKPIKLNAWKFESFIFDAIPLARKSCCMEVLREDEFAPLKNSTGNDSPKEVSEKISNYYARWLAEANIKVAPGVKIEISPSFACEKKDFLQKYRSLENCIEKDTYIT